MGLHYCGVAVYIDHEPRQEVAFAVNETECVGGAVGQPQSSPQSVCLHEAVAEEIGVDSFRRIEREHTDSDAADLEVSCADNASVGGSYSDKVSFVNAVAVLRHECQGSGENPWMKAVERLLFAFAQRQERKSGIGFGYSVFHFMKNR